MVEPLPDRDVEALIQGYLEGDLTPEESARLLEALRGNPGWARVLLDHLRDHQVLGDVMRESEGLPVPVPQASRSRIRAARRLAVPRRALWLGPAAAAVVLAGFIAWLASTGSRSRPPDPALPRTPDVASAGKAPDRSPSGDVARLESERRRIHERLDTLERERRLLAPGPETPPPDDPSRQRDLAQIETDRKALEAEMARTVEAMRQVRGRESEKTPPAPPEVAGPAAQPLEPASPAGPTVVAVARVGKVEEPAWLLTAAGERSAVRPGAPLFAGQGIATAGGRGRATLVFPDRTRLDLEPDSVLRLDAAGGADLEGGSLAADVARQAEGRTFAVRTPLGSARVLGTRFTLSVTADAMRVEVQDGVVAVTRREDGETVNVPAGQHAVVARGAPLAARKPAPVPPLAGRTLHVDAAARHRGTGAPDAPFRTLQDALQAAAAGTCILVHDGLYRESLVTVRGGEGESRRIVVRAEHPRRAVVSSPDGALRIAHPWIVVEGLVIDGESGPSDAVIVDTAGDHAALHDLEVRNAGRDGIDLRSPRDVLVEGCWIHDAYAAPPHTAHGIVTFAVAGLTVRDTEVHHCSGSGILLMQEGDDPLRSWDAVTIERCAVWTAPLTQPRPGVPAGVAPGVAAVVAQRGPGSPPGRLTIRASRFHGWGGSAGTAEAAVRLRGTVSALLDGNRVYDNAVGVWIDDGGSAGLRPAVSLTAAGNVFHGNGTAILCGGPVELTGLFWNNTFGLGHRQALRFGAPPARVEFLNNLFVGADVPVEARGPSNLRVPGEAVVSAREHDYRPAAGSPAVEAGVDIPQAGRDVRGVPRPPGARPDVGAFQLAPKERRP
jgi:ferric-dicitrate binding protein FerR (iron transport regulator)